MATLNCPACAATVDGDLEACPQCGVSLLVASETGQAGGDLRTIAIGQKWLLYALLLSLLAQVPIFLLTRPGAFPPAGLALTLVIAVIQIAALCKLGVALKMHIASIIFCSLLMLVPCVSLITLMVINDKATKKLQAAGIKVGLMGAKLSALP